MNSIHITSDTSPSSTNGILKLVFRNSQHVFMPTCAKSDTVRASVWVCGGPSSEFMSRTLLTIIKQAVLIYLFVTMITTLLLQKL